jgi:hypothetical protein
MYPIDTKNLARSESAMTALPEPRPVDPAIAKEASRLFDLPPYELE